MNKPIASSLTTAFASQGLLSGNLSANAVAALLAAVGDVAFVLSKDGVILDFAVSQGDLANRGFSDWIGLPWIDTVTPETRPKIAEMLETALDPDAPSRWRQVNHLAAGGGIPVRYLLLRLGDGDRLIAVGRDMLAAAAIQQRLLETQQSLERAYIRLRHAETRYRLMFDMASEAVLIVDATTRRIREANPAAHRLLEMADGALIGQPAYVIVDSDDRDDFVGHLGAAEAADDLAPTELRLADERGKAMISAKLFRQDRTPLLLVRIALTKAAIAGQRFDKTLSEVVERIPDALVLIDSELNVLTANAAFVELTETPSVERITGAPLATWLGRPGIDLELIIGQLRAHGSVRNVATILRGATGAQEEIEVSGVVAPMGKSECYGFTIRTVRARTAPAILRAVPRSVEQLTELVGRMSLKEIVRESTDLIESLCIEAALIYTSDNRASAAEVLGVSRQSLYSKLHKHGLGNLISSDS